LNRRKKGGQTRINASGTDAQKTAAKNHNIPIMAGGEKEKREDLQVAKDMEGGKHKIFGMYVERGENVEREAWFQ